MAKLLAIVAKSFDALWEMPMTDDRPINGYNEMRNSARVGSPKVHSCESY